MDLAMLRSALTCIGQTALAGEVVGALMFGVALLFGVHCPHCDRLALGARFEWWQGYFDVIDLMQVSGLAFGLAALLGAERRVFGLAALLLGLLGLGIRPM